MSRDLIGLLDQHRDELIDRLQAQLALSSAPRYRGLDRGLLASRVRLLVDHLARSFSEGASAFVEHVSHLAEERFREGFYLEEVQAALSHLELYAWELVVRELPADQHASLLGRLTCTVGLAKDRLAQIYLARTEQATPPRDSRRLFAGTEPAPLVETIE